MKLAPFQSPLAALNDLRAAAHGSKDKVALAWEREDGNVFRFDVPLPSRIAPKALPEVRRLVERVASSSSGAPAAGSSASPAPTPS